MDRVIKLGAVTLHIPNRCEEEKRKVRENLGATMLQIWLTKTPEQRQKMVDEYKNTNW